MSGNSRLDRLCHERNERESMTEAADPLNVGPSACDKFYVRQPGKRKPEPGRDRLASEMTSPARYQSAFAKSNRNTSGILRRSVIGCAAESIVRNNLRILHSPHVPHELGVEF